MRKPKPKITSRIVSLTECCRIMDLPLDVLVRAIERGTFNAQHGLIGELPKVRMEFFEGLFAPGVIGAVPAGTGKRGKAA